MNSNCLAQPKFYPRQTVGFIGGTGKIINRQLEANKWIYTVEMIMGSEPDFGRVGAETTIVLEESEIQNLVRQGTTN